MVVWYTWSMMGVTYNRASTKALAKMPSATAYRIRAKIYAYAVDPSSQAKNVTAMSGYEGHVQLRVGDWRVVMEDGAVYSCGSHLAARRRIQVEADITELVTATRGEYEHHIRLDGDYTDDLAIDKHRRKMAACEEEMLPSEFIDRMLAGESILKLWREHRGVNQSELARVSGVNRVVIVDIEAGRSGGSLGALKNLADALGLTVDDLL